MKITSAIITRMPRPMPEGMFDPMPEVVGTFEYGSIKSSFAFFADEVSFQSSCHLLRGRKVFGPL